MIKVIFENENFVVCDKSALVLSVPARERDDARPCLGLDLQQKYQRSVFPVHRLDYEVSGLIIYALNSKAHKISQDWFLKKTISKRYEALTSVQDFSHWPEKVATERTIITSDIGQQFYWSTKIHRGKKRSFESEHGEWAETEAVIVNHEGSKLRWDLFPLTGKPHQLRLELARRGFPILGDKLYGSAIDNKQDGIALKAVELNLSNVDNKLGLPTRIFLK
ncbi:MAG: RNA pseudouridine synthase [Bdellovibrio sp.]|nr:RNA pseudouridine synthase [Bdellovibrio sp.]